VEVLSFLLALIFALAILGGILYNIFSIVRSVFLWVFGDYINTYLLIADIDPLYKAPIKKYMPYYRLLDPLQKRTFEKRVQKFINQKEFVPRGMDRITYEMKALIAGTAIQLTFGYPSIYFMHFKRILVYPDSYYSKISQRYHKGEVNMGGLIVLSWNNFVEGFIKPDDGRNLGLHEMAHALRLENAIENEEYGFLDDSVLRKWTDLCYREIEKMQNGESTFLRAYASANSQEFFAVAVENFFERPAEFVDWHPELYETLAGMLKQDPLKMAAQVADAKSAI
jgi:Mlc titration factor MtfA (ptsG expression regulator)